MQETAVRTETARIVMGVDVIRLDRKESVSKDMNKIVIISLLPYQ